MPTMKINDIEVEVAPKENVIQASRRAGVEIPHYCWHPDLTVVASCRMCLVEVGDQKPTGEIVMGPKLVPACQTPTKPDMVVRTDSAKVKQSQATTLEYLLLNHPLDCSVCDQAGECYLQDYTYKFGNTHSRLQEPKVQRLDKYHIGDQIVLFTDRCVMCTRCVRFTREISGTSELQVISRGSLEEIDVFPGEPCNNKLAGNVVDLCPVGALCSKDFLYKKRVWWLKHQESVCTRCSTGCSIHVDESDDRVYRVRPRENPLAQGRFMCDEGRFGFHYIHDSSRLLTPRLGKAKAAGTPPATASNGSGSIVQEDAWPGVLSAVRSAITQSEARTWGVLSPFMTCEEAYLLAAWIKESKLGRLALGPVPMVGQDDSYPKGPKGESPSPRATKFTIRAEKVPNRWGIQAVLEHFEGSVVAWKDCLEAAKKGEIDVLYFVGLGPSYAWAEAELEAIDQVGTLIVQDILESPLSQKADVVLAGCSFAEKEGTFVNYAGLAQEIRPAIRPLADVRPDGRILMELSGRRGLFHAESIREEMAEKIKAFAPWKGKSLSPFGVPLETKTLTASVVQVR